MNGLLKFDVFVEQHRNQLGASGVPQLFWEALHQKLSLGVCQECCFITDIFLLNLSNYVM